MIDRGFAVSRRALLPLQRLVDFYILFTIRVQGCDGQPWLSGGEAP